MGNRELSLFRIVALSFLPHPAEDYHVIPRDFSYLETILLYRCKKYGRDTLSAYLFFFFESHF